MLQQQSPKIGKDDDAVAALHSEVSGRVLLPEDHAYDEARLNWNRAFVHEPAIVVQAATPEDVVQAVRFAAQHTMPVGVLATGHGFVSGVDDALLINTARLKMLHVDPEARTAYIGAGLLWKEVLAETAPYGLAPLPGSSPEVGVVGYTLGGGMGWLVRQYGLALDSVNSFDVVTADGQMRRASTLENPDLFWALKGGGGAFGVVVGMEIRLHPVTHVYGGSLVYPIQMADKVLRRFRTWAPTLPEAMTTSVAIMNFPNILALPEPVRGQSFVMLRGCYCGDPPQAGAELIQPWLEWHRPIDNQFRVMPFTEVGSISQDPVDPAPHYVSGAWMAEMTDDAVETLIHYGYNSASSPVNLTEIRYVAGAMSRVNGATSAYSQRQTPLFFNIVAGLSSPEKHSEVEHYAQRFKDELSSSLTGNVYMNYLEGRESYTRVGDAYPPETLDRLRQLKAQYDPNNLFRFAFHIVPAGQN